MLTLNCISVISCFCWDNYDRITNDAIQIAPSAFSTFYNCWRLIEIFLNCSIGAIFAFNGITVFFRWSRQSINAIQIALCPFSTSNNSWRLIQSYFSCSIRQGYPPQYKLFPMVLFWYVHIIQGSTTSKQHSLCNYDDRIWAVRSNRILLPPCFLASIIQRLPNSCSQTVCILPKYHTLHTLIFSMAYPKNILLLNRTYIDFSTHLQILYLRNS